MKKFTCTCSSSSNGRDGSDCCDCFHAASLFYGNKPPVGDMMNNPTGTCSSSSAGHGGGGGCCCVFFPCCISLFWQ